MVEAGRFPGIGTVTLRALAAEMVGRSVPTMAGDTVRRTHSAVIKRSRQPSVGIMAGRTLPGIMVGWLVAAMTGDTVRRTRNAMIEGRRQPGIGTVAGRTLPRIMVTGAVRRVAGKTVRCPSNRMVEGGRPPGTGAVAGRTLSRIMVCRPVYEVTAVAILCNTTGMVENDLIPLFNRMARPTFKTKQSVMWFILRMATDTCRVISLIGGVLMAVETLQPIMPANQQKPGGAVIKDGKFPSFRCMAYPTLVAHLVLVHIILLVAGFTRLRGVFEHLDGSCPRVALSAIQEGVQIVEFEGETIVIKIGSVGFNPIMAVQTGIAEQGNVISHQYRSHLFMANRTIRHLKAGKPRLVAILTHNLTVPGHPAVSLQ